MATYQDRWWQVYCAAVASCSGDEFTLAGCDNWAADVANLACGRHYNGVDEAAGQADADALVADATGAISGCSSWDEHNAALAEWRNHMRRKD
jgi:hypothetical protein